VGKGYDIIPDVACTIRKIHLGDAESLEEAVEIDNTITATIDGIYKYGGVLEHNGGVSSNTFKSRNGVVSALRLKDVEIISDSTGSIDIDIRNADGLIVDGCIAPNEIYLVGSINIKHGINDHDGYGYDRAGGLGSGATMSHLDRILLTSGSSSITSFGRVTPGQIITCIFDGGTQTFTDGTNMILAGNITGSAGDTLTLICDDPASGGPLATSTMREVSRSVN